MVLILPDDNDEHASFLSQGTRTVRISVGLGVLAALSPSVVV
jgi:hypothetical protein